MRKELLGSVAAALCLCVSAAAWAQTAPATGRLEEVIVTAQKRAQNVQKTAIPLTVVTGAQLKAEAKNGLDQILKDVPSLQIQASPQGADIVLRGVGGNDVGNNADPDVAVMVDGVYNGNSSAVMSSVYDTARIEVLRGPEGTLIGRNAAGGAVSIATNDPTKKFGAGLNLGIGNLNLYHADGYLNVPFGDVVAVRVAADRDSRNGYYTNGAGEINNLGARIKVKYTPNADLSVLGRFEYWNQRGYTETTVPTPIANSSACTDGTSAPCFLFAAVDPKNPWDTATFAHGPFNVHAVANNNKSYTYSLDAEYNLGFGTVTLMPSFTRTVSLQTQGYGLFAPSGGEVADWAGNIQDQYTGEARINSLPGSLVTWVAGVYVLESDSSTSGANTGGGSDTYTITTGSGPTAVTTGPFPWATNLATVNTNPAASISGFAQATYPVRDNFRVTLGGRYNTDSKTQNWGICSTYIADECVGNYTSPTGTNYNSGIGSIHASYNSFTYKAGVEYDITPAAMGYAQVSTGYKAGGFSSATTPPTTYEPENLTDIEAGVKSRWLDNRLQVNADAYAYLYHNQQIELHEYSDQSTIFGAGNAGLVPAGLNVLQIVDVNAGNSRYYGLEEQTKYNITDDDQISLDVAYEKANYGTFIIPTIPGDQPPGGQNVVNGVEQNSYDLSGRTEAHAPTWNGTFGYQHVFNLGIGPVTFHSSTHFQTASFDTIQEWFADGNTIQKGYHQTDLYLNWTSLSGRFSAGAWVKNLENNAIVTSVYPLFKETLGEPRTYGMTAGYSF